MFRRTSFAVYVLVIAASLPAFGISPRESPHCSTIKEQMVKSRIPDLAVAFFADGQVETAYCSIVGTRLGSGSIFEAASLSKPVFAAAVLLLVKQHRLDLDRPLSEYLKHPYTHQQHPFTGGSETDIVVDPRFAKITARMVLSHTSGLPNWSRSGPLTFLATPGKTWSYSSEGYVYLQRVVEAVTGQPLDAFVKASVLIPLGTTHSTFKWNQHLSGQLMSGHDASGTAQPEQDYLHPLAPSTLYTTLDDYARFVSRLLDPPAKSQYAMEESKQVAVRPDLELAWGLGLRIEDTSTPSYFHWGSNPGFQSFFLCQPRTSRAVLFLADSDNGLDLIDSLVHEAVPGDHPVLGFPMLHPTD